LAEGETLRHPFLFETHMKNENKQHSAFWRQSNAMGQLVLESRVANAFELGVSRYPIHRVLRYAARVELEALFDAIALDPAWHAERLNSEVMLIEGDGLFCSAYGNRQVDYCTCW